jgi:hypothetical protein
MQIQIQIRVQPQQPLTLTQPLPPKSPIAMRPLAHQLVPPLAAGRVAKVVGAAVGDDVFGDFLPGDFGGVEVGVGCGGEGGDGEG